MGDGNRTTTEDPRWDEGRSLLMDQPLDELRRQFHEAAAMVPGDHLCPFIGVALCDEIEKKDGLIYEAMLKYGELEQEFHKRVCQRNRTTSPFCGVCALEASRE